MNNEGPLFLNPPSLSTPPGYTHIVTTTRGTTVYLAGQVALDKNGELVGRGDIEAQTEQVFLNIQNALLAVGGDLSNIVKLTTFITDARWLPIFRQVRDKVIPPGPKVPASSLVQVAALAGPDFLIEIEAIAWLP